MGLIDNLLAARKRRAQERADIRRIRAEGRRDVADLRTEARETRSNMRLDRKERGGGLGALVSDIGDGLGSLFGGGLAGAQGRTAALAVGGVLVLAGVGAVVYAARKG